MLAVISWIVTGLVLGLIARLLIPGRQSMGIILTIVLGIVGAFVGGLIGSAIWGVPAANNPDYSQMWQGWILSIIGAVIVLWGYLALTSRRTVDRPV